MLNRDGSSLTQKNCPSPNVKRLSQSLHVKVLVRELPASGRSPEISTHGSGSLRYLYRKTV